MDTITRAKEIEGYLIETKEYLNGVGECGFKLYKTVEFIEARLKEVGYNAKRCGKMGISVLIDGDSDKTVLLRADMDALPTADVPRHLCGHDMHTSMLLGCAKIIAESKKKPKCNVKLLFQPAEETLEGAKDCIEAGILENPRVDAAFMIHVLPSIPLPIGSVIIPKRGYGAPGACFFKISLFGKPCHGAAPQNGIDAISLTSAVISGINHLISKEFFNQNALITIGKLTAGEAANTIAEKAVLEGTLRALDNDIFIKLKERLIALCSSISKAYGARAEFETISECPPLLNSGELVDFATSLFNCTKGINAVLSDELGNSGRELGGSEDFASFSALLPSLMLGIPAGEPINGYTYPLHHPSVRFDNNALAVGAAVYTSIALNYGG